MLKIDDLEVGYNKNAWLFTETNPDYKLFIYYCTCGHTTIEYKQIEYFTCKQCSNSTFYTTDTVIYAHNYLSVNIDMPPVVKKQSDFYSVELFYNHPVSFDSVSKTLQFTPEKVYEFRIHFDTQWDEIFINSPTSYAKDLAYAHLIDFIAMQHAKRLTNFEILNYHNASKDKKNQIAFFFLRHNTIEDASFFLWKRFDKTVFECIEKTTLALEALPNLLGKHISSKALRKTLYRRYSYTINSFDALTPYVISKIFDDTNFVRTLLEDTNFTLGSIDRETFKQEVDFFLDFFFF